MKMDMVLVREETRTCCAFLTSTLYRALIVFGGDGVKYQNCSLSASPLLRQRESIIGVQLGQGNPNPRVHRSSGKRGFAEFPTGTVDPRVWISRFHCSSMIDSISHISNKNINLLYIWRDTVVNLWRRNVKYVTLEMTSDVLKRF